MAAWRGDLLRRLLEWRRPVVVWATVALGSVVVGGLIGVWLVSGPGPSRSAAIARLEALDPGSLMPAPHAVPEKLKKPLGMGSLHAGIALLADSPVADVRTPQGSRRAPEGSSLLAFEVGDWTCENEPCASWTTLRPQVVVDGTARDLPAGGDIFVLVVPPGTAAVDLTIEADGYAQKLSLLDHSSSADNIALLGAQDAEHKVILGRSFRLAEHTSVALDDGTGRQTDQFVRQVGIEYAQLRFFLNGQTPSGPGKAFLVINAYYSYLGRTGFSIFGPQEAFFLGDDGTRYDARDLDPDPQKGLLGFEVPATLRSGTLVLGGTVGRTSTTGVPYTATLAEQRVPIKLS